LKFDLPGPEPGLVIVDDSKELLSVYEKYFKAAGLRIAAKFSNVEDTLTYFGTHGEAADDLVVLLDHRMGDVNALDIARRLKEKSQRRRIILTVTEGSIRFKIDERLFDDIIFKPFTISELIASIEKTASPIRLKGSRIFSKPEEIDNLLKQIISDCTEKLCSVRNPALIRNGAHLRGHISTYASALAKGLKVFLVTEINQENLIYCKQLMMNRGVQLRHLDGVTPNFVVWDEKHVAETVEKSSEAHPLGQLLYSNLESDVSRNQYLFEYFWKRARPADARIRELEGSPDLDKIRVISGYDDLLKIRLEMVREAQSSLDICALSGVVSKAMIPSAFQDHADAVARGVRVRYLFEIKSNEDVESARKLLNAGIEVRHLQNSVTVFGVSEKASIWMVTVKGAGINDETKGMYSMHSDYVEEYRSIFEVLWNSGVPARKMIMEFEENQKNDFSTSRLQKF